MERYKLVRGTEMIYNTPYSVQIELCSGCTRKCKFCGLSTVGNKPYKFMSLELAENIAKQLGSWFDHKRVEFALRGEPTLNPNCVKIISFFREYFPKSQLTITTNGDVIKKDFRLIDQLFDNGLNLLMVDTYEKYDWWLDNLKQMKYQLYDFYDDKPTVYGYKGFLHQEIVLADDLTKKSGKNMRKKLNNQAGNVNCPELGIVPLKYPLVRRCSNPFRELVIFYDGKVPICCMDYKNEFIVGKTPELSLKEIWNSTLYDSVRQLLYNKQRNFAPCNKCDYKGYRVGLINEPEIDINDAKVIVGNYVKLEKSGLEEFVKYEI